MDYLVNIIWKSERLELEKRKPLSVSFYELYKWHFLLENLERMKKIVPRLKQLGTEITFEIKQANIELVFECTYALKDKREFDQWKSECYKIVEEFLSDLLIVTVKCRKEATKAIQDMLFGKFSSTVEIMEQKNSDGVCLVGSGESLIAFISDIRNMEGFGNASILETETNQEIGIRSIHLTASETHCWKLFDGVGKAKERFPTLKIYFDLEGKSLKVIGNKDDVRQMEDFMKNSPFLYFHHKETKTFDKETIEFLSQEVVKEFLDSKIKKETMGTWILDTEKNTVEAYSMDDKKVTFVLETLCKSFQDLRYHIAGVEKCKDKLRKLYEWARKLETETNGKFSKLFRKTDKPGDIEVHILCTSDLLNNKEVANLLYEIKEEEENGAKAADVRLEFSPENFQFIRKMEKDLALKHDVDVKFGEENILILKGDEASVSAVKGYIDGLKLMQKSIFLPQSLTMDHSPESLSKEHGCLLKKIKSNSESKVWFMNNSIVMVYHGQPRKDLCVDSQALLRFSDGDNKGEIIKKINMKIFLTFGL